MKETKEACRTNPRAVPNSLPYPISSTDLFVDEVARDRRRSVVNRCMKSDQVPPPAVILNSTAIEAEDHPGPASTLAGSFGLKLSRG